MERLQQQLHTLQTKVANKMDVDILPPPPVQNTQAVSAGTIEDVPRWAVLLAGALLFLIVFILILVTCVYLAKTAGALKHLSRMSNQHLYYHGSSNAPPPQWLRGGPPHGASTIFTD